MKFKRLIENTNPGQTYDLEEFTMKAGKKYVYYDQVQAARPDTEIYETLEKYGTIDPMIVNKEQLYMDLRNFKTDLRSLTEMNMKAEEMWNQLPGKVKEKFDNNKDIFMRDGEKYLKEEIAKETPDLTQATTATVTEGTKNE